jgi:hypothetical protein
MIKITQEQLDALAVSLCERANVTLTNYARNRFRLEFNEVSDVELTRLAERVRKTATTYDLERENDIATFLDFSVMYGEDFHRDDWAREILRDNTLHGPDRMQLLRHKVRLENVDI